MPRARTTMILLLTIPLLLGIWVTASRIDWSGPPRPPARPVPLHDDSLRDFHLTINGLNPLEHPLTLASQERFLLNLGYTRDSMGGQSYDHIVMLLVYDDDTETGRIETEHFVTLELKYEEQQRKQGLLEWKSRPSRGQEGLVRWFNARPGAYELRVCWKREPKTVAELAAQRENPFRFLYPFYRAEIRIAPRLPRRQG